jgi:D-amino peptidase
MLITCSANRQVKLNSESVNQRSHRSYNQVLILADIEGSSGCWQRRAAAFMTRSWARACAALTADLNAVGGGLFEAGVTQITIHDFHRTGFNILPRRLDARIKLRQGYRSGPIPGIGTIPTADAVMFIGMHAAAGTAGFLAHTLTSRLARLEVNGHILPEVALFASSLAPFGLRPLFFSGCPIACAQARQLIPGIGTIAIDKRTPLSSFDAAAWRRQLAEGAVASLGRRAPAPFSLTGPMHARLTMRGGARAARQIQRRWQLSRHGDQVRIEAENIHVLYLKLIQVCYLTPMLAKMLPLSLIVYRSLGRLGLAWAERTAGQTRLDQS